MQQEIRSLFRSIIEQSTMINNDEYVLYAESPMSRGDADPLKLVISRPVYKFEIEAGLIPKSGRLLDQKDPDITQFTDAFWRVKTILKDMTRMFGDDIQKVVPHFIACHYYDCMSGGCAKYVVSIIRYACEKFGIPDEIEVYPGEEGGWHTIADFLAETKGVPDIRDIFGEHVKSLPWEYKSQ